MQQQQSWQVVVRLMPEVRFNEFRHADDGNGEGGISWPCALVDSDDGSITLRKSPAHYPFQRYRFHNAFDSDVPVSLLSSELGDPLVHRVLGGESCTFFSYGRSILQSGMVQSICASLVKAVGEKVSNYFEK